MTDISSWSPVDDSNTAGVPNGWPENMQPSGVNNCGRMMMGAVRRWYDVVQSGSFVLPYLSTAGGTVNGDINTNALRVKNPGTSDYDFGLFYTSGQPTLNFDANYYWHFNPADGHLLWTTPSANPSVDIAPTGELTTTAYANFKGLNASEAIFTPALTATGNVQVNGTLNAGAVTSGNISGSNITASGTVTGGYVTSTGDVHANNAVTAPTLNITGNGTISGTLTAGAATITNATINNNLVSNAITSNTTISAVSGMNAGYYDIGGRAMTRGDANSLSVYTPGGIRIFMTELSGGYNSYNNTAHYIREVTGANSFAYFNAAGSYNVTGSWNVISDDRVKEGIAPYNTAGLDAIRALNPVSFRYIPGTPFADEAGTRRYGLMASEVAAVLPEMVGSTEMDGQEVRTLAPGHLVYVLLNAVKELATRLDALEAQP